MFAALTMLLSAGVECLLAILGVCRRAKDDRVEKICWRSDQAVAPSRKDVSSLVPI